MVRGATRESLSLRVSPELKSQIEEYAAQTGISINAAACVLLAEGPRGGRGKQ